MQPSSRSPTPVETARRQAVDRLVLVFVGCVSLIHVVGGLARIFAPPPPVEAPLPMAVDLALDSAGRLTLLPGIGPKRAASILEDRRARGPIRRLEELTRIRGIGPATVRRLAEAREVRVVVSGRSATRTSSPAPHR